MSSHRMNAYTVASLSNSPDVKPLYMLILMFTVVPIVYGNLLDIGLTEVAGSQHCSFKDGDTRCVIFGKEIPSLSRSAGRAGIQLVVLITSLVLFKKYLPAYNILIGQSALGVTGIVLLFLTQTDMLADFRRLFSEALFKIKYH